MSSAAERLGVRERAKEWGGFSMTYHGELGKLWEMVSERRLHPMDLCVAAFLQSRMSMSSGRIEVRTKDVAKELGLSASQLTPSIKRLRTELLLAKGLTGTGYYWMLNPAVWHVGGVKMFNQRWGQFKDLINE